eukprot:5149253-Pleurochrysis_carterae.AAC.1
MLRVEESSADLAALHLYQQCSEYGRAWKRCWNGAARHLQEEDVGALHQRIEDLCRSQRPFSAAHDLAALCDARNGKAARDVERERPVVLSMLRDLLGRPEELHALHVHPCSCPHMNQVVTDSLDALQVASHFVVHQSKPVSNPENECAA